MDVPSIGKLEATGDFATSAFRRPLVSYRSVAPIAIMLDVLAITTACAIWSLLSADARSSPGLLILGTAPIACALFVSTAKLAGLYRPSAFLSQNPHEHIVSLVWFGTVALLGFSSVALGGQDGQLRVDPALAFVLVGWVMLLAHRLCWRYMASKAFIKGAMSGRKAVLIYQGSFISDLGAPDLERHGLRIEHKLSLGAPDDDEHLVAQRVDLAVEIAQNSKVDEILIAADVGDWQRLKPHFARLRQLPLPVSLIARDWLAEFVRQPAHILGSSTLVELQHPPLNVLQRAAKRVLDIVVSVCGLVLLWPLLTFMALLIQFDSPGPVLFRQTRIGFNGKAFKIYKFRTMTVLEDGADVRQATQEDERITPFGRWLRKTSIDELPQLFNVLKGDMSIVGPRPHAVLHDSHFGQLIADYALRRRMKPGITGWAQVSGFRGGTPEVDLMTSRVQLDMLYIEKWSIWLDLRIIVHTIFVVLRGHNAY